MTRSNRRDVTSAVAITLENSRLNTLFYQPSTLRPFRRHVRMAHMDMMQIKMLLQVEYNCCKLKNLAANKIKLLQIEKKFDGKLK